MPQESSSTTGLEAQIRAACWSIITLWPQALPHHPPGVAYDRDQVHTSADGSNPPVPVGVLSLRRHTGELLTDYVNLVLDQRRTTGGQRFPGTGLTREDVPALARYLKRHADWLAHHEQAETIAADLAKTARDLEWVAAPDRAALQYVGPCLTDTCGVDLYAKPDARTIRCRLCGREEDVDDRRAFLSAAARERLLTAAGISRAMPVLVGQRCTQARISVWKKRERLVPVQVDRDGRDLYRVGDVEELLRGTTPTVSARDGHDVRLLSTSVLRSRSGAEGVPIGTPAPAPPGPAAPRPHP